VPSEIRNWKSYFATGPKRQKSVYGSHRKNRLIVPIALDMIREASAISDSKFHSPCMMLARRHMTQNPCYSLRSLQVLPTGALTRARVLLDSCAKLAS